jgi:hypothetical protein
VPDWTYHPLRRPMGLLLGERRSHRLALAVISSVARFPGGRAIVSGLGRTTPPASARRQVAGLDCVAPVGASVSVSAGADAIRALPPLGAGLIEIGPVHRDDVPKLRTVLDSATCPVLVRLAGDDAVAVALELAPFASAFVLDLDGADEGVLARLRSAVEQPVLTGARAHDAARAHSDVGLVLRDGRTEDLLRLKGRHSFVLVTSSNPSIDFAADVAGGAQAVLADQEGLIAAGPAWFQRATAEILDRAGLFNAGATSGPRVAWLAGVGLGLGMIAGGLGAAAVALGPVLLPYDASYLRLDASTLGRLNPQLIHFLQHDRITLAGTMVALGILYASLSWWGIREGRAWARDAVLGSGLVGFPTLFYFFAFHYVEPVHVALALILLPLFLIAVWRRPPLRLETPDGDERPRERYLALIGQLSMVSVGAGFIIGGGTISSVGLTTVFVPSDLGFMSTSAHALAAANDRLLGFVAHDRAGFGGALISTGVAVLLVAAWGWHRGQAWVWWTLAVAALAGFGAAIAIHISVGYTDFLHLAPVYAGSVLTATSLVLSRPYLLRSR